MSADNRPYNEFVKPSNANWHTEDVAMISELAIQCAEGTCIATVCVYTVLYRHAGRGERTQIYMHSVSERQKHLLFWKTNPF